jgi:plasmid stabilization system protein ParE
MKLRFTPPALADLDDILAFLRADSPAGADRALSRIEAVLERLMDYPKTGRLTTKRGVRYVNIQPYPYLIFYRPLANEIEVIAIRHGARSPRSMPARPR